MIDESKHFIFKVGDSRCAWSADGPFLHAQGFDPATGEGPLMVRSLNGALPMGLDSSADYWAIRLSAENFRLATSKLNAESGVAVHLTTPGSGTFLIGPAQR